MPTSIIPNLWFPMNAEEAVDFYVSVFPNSSIGFVSHYGPDSPGPEGTVMTIDFTLDGNRFTAINGGDQFPFNEAVSFLVDCPTQDEVDRYWDALTADGGEEIQCGWLKDRFGLSWQIVPEGFEAMMTDPDPERVQRAMQAMFGMKKLVLADLQAAADGTA